MRNQTVSKFSICLIWPTPTKTIHESSERKTCGLLITEFEKRKQKIAKTGTIELLINFLNPTVRPVVDENKVQYHKVELEKRAEQKNFF